MNITDDQVEAALTYLRDNAVPYGKAVGQCKYLDHKRKIVRAEIFNRVEGTVASREAEAESHPDYINVVEEYRRAETERATILTLMKAAELKIEVWRSMNARAKRGHL